MTQFRYWRKFMPAYWNSKQGIPRTDQLVFTPTFWWKTAKLLDYIQITDNRLITIFGWLVGRIYIKSHWMNVSQHKSTLLQQTVFLLCFCIVGHSDVWGLNLLVNVGQTGRVTGRVGDLVFLLKIMPQCSYCETFHTLHVGDNGCSEINFKLPLQKQKGEYL